MLWEHPEANAVELARMLPGRSAEAVRCARKRFGRYNRAMADLSGVCVCCDARPVWEGSPRARAMRLCKGCFLEEMERREGERTRANAERQRRFKRKGRPGDDEAHGRKSVYN